MKNNCPMSRVKYILHSTFFILHLSAATILHLNIPCFLEFVGDEFAFVPPFLSESTDERRFQELIDGERFLLA